jgi:hypothetical protein
VASQVDHQGTHPETLGRHEYLQALAQPCDVRTL